ncbi:SecDF P1 head subdomain-containing protein [Amycolatopsis sp. cmx-4-61]|uniref:SecDF P1 head subdomain-containing protein n=1 Tax=Amycolatopsis sp. cmx-4-61 TaxID=2790937 RepID=UPI00397BE718
MRIFLAAIAVLLAAAAAAAAAVAGCQAGVPVKEGTHLRFRPVLSELPAGPAVGPPGQRQSTDPATQDAAARALPCVPEQPDELDGRDDPALPLAGCDRTRGTRYVLGPGFLSGAEVASVEAGVDPLTGGSVITFGFTEAGTATWAEWTGHHLGKPLAVVLRGRVIGTAVIRSAITDGTVRIKVTSPRPGAQQLVREITGA